MSFGYSFVFPAYRAGTDKWEIKAFTSLFANNCIVNLIIVLQCTCCTNANWFCCVCSRNKTTLF
uniref:Uncharacterized protein n=1 Tax=Rhizophora mucronata TaxID=61149 RepID=A0A2P2N4Y6_RHIMU